MQQGDTMECPISVPLVSFYIMFGRALSKYWGRGRSPYGQEMFFQQFTWSWYHVTYNWMAPGKNRITAISTEIFKYVRIHPNFASRPVWFEKMFLCFFLKAGRKDLTNRPAVFGYTRYEKPRATQRRTVGWGGERENFRPVCQVFSSCF